MRGVRAAAVAPCSAAVARAAEAAGRCRLEPVCARRDMRRDTSRAGEQSGGGESLGGCYLYD